MSTICTSTFNNTTPKAFCITGNQMTFLEKTLAALKGEGIDKPEDLF